MDWIVLDEKIVKIVYVFFYFAITFSSEIQVLNFIWTNLDSFFVKLLCVYFGWFWPKDMKILLLHSFIPIVSRLFPKVTHVLANVLRNIIFFLPKWAQWPFVEMSFEIARKRSLTSFWMVAHYIGGFMKVSLNSSIIFSFSVLTVSRKNC